MKKAQATIVGTILISGIIMSLVGVTLVWGKPLIDKTTDKTQVNIIIRQLEEVDSTIKYVAETGSTQSEELNLGTDDSMKITEGEIEYKTKTRVPIIASRDWVPINNYAMPTRKKTVIASRTYCDDYIAYEEDPSTACNGYAGYDVDTKCCYTAASSKEDCSEEETFTTGKGCINPTLDNVTIGDKNFRVDFEPDGETHKVCFYELEPDTGEPATTATLCKTKDILEAGETRREIINEEMYDLRSITDDYLFMLGEEEEENIGVLGRDEPGIIIGKTRLGRINEVTLKLVYRGLEDEQGVTHSYDISCKKSCAVSKGKHKLRISLERIERKAADTTTIYLNLEFE